MTFQFSGQWPITQRDFRKKLEDPKFGNTWDYLIETARSASVRGHKASDTGNHVDVRINWGGRSKTIHLSTSAISGPLAAQSIIGELISVVAPQFHNWIVEYKSVMTSEWSYGTCVQLSELLYKDASAAGVSFLSDLVNYVTSFSICSAEEAQRKHAMRAALDEARPLIRKAIANGCDPEVFMSLINECIVEEVLDK